MIRNPITITPKQLWTAITVVAALVVATSAVTWEIRKDVVDALKRQIESYEKSNNWKLPETITEIRKASEALTLQLNERKELEALRAETAKLREHNSRLEAALKTSSDKLATAEATLDNIIRKTDVIELSEGQSAALVENNVYLGVKNVARTYASVSLAERSEILDIGETKKYSFGAKACRVTLLRVLPGAPNRAVFNHGCA
jgi:predicted nuclease with TOPRIM domain